MGEQGPRRYGGALEEKDAGRPEQSDKDKEIAELKEKLSRLEKEREEERRQFALKEHHLKLQIEVEASRMKKNQAVALLLERIVLFKEAGQMSYEAAAKTVGWGIQSMRRYLKRIGKDEPPIKKRGPKAHVVRMEDIESLRSELARLPHGAKRTAGAGELERKYRSRMPREDDPEPREPGEEGIQKAA